VRPITVYLADNHQIVLQGISSSIEHEAAMQVVGRTTDSLNVLDDLVRLRPDVLVLDLMMPNLPGFEILRRVQEHPSLSTRVVVFTMHGEIGYVVQALHQGAMGFVLKDVDTAFLIEAIRAVADGREYLSPPFSSDAIHAYQQRRDASRLSEVDIWDELSRRERETLVLVAQGLTNRQIGRKLNISFRTVEKHRASMMKKAHFKSEADLIQFAIRRGLIPPE